MNTPDTTNAVPSALDKRQFITAHSLPKRLDTVTADVLARLLSYQRLTGLETVSKASTTRLAAVAYYLANDYGWAIETTSKAAGCSDGRVAWVHEYWLPAETVARAMAAGAGEWCAKVRAARLARRAKAAQARREANKANASRLARRAHPGQGGLFEGGAL